MGSNFHYTIDLNEDQNHQTFFSPLGSSLHHNQHIHHLQAPNFNPSSSSSSLTSPSLSYLPFLINSHQDQVPVGYNNNTFHGFLDPLISQPLETNKIVSINGGSSSSSDQMVPKKEARLKLMIRKKDNYQNQIHFPQYPTKGDETEASSIKWISSKVRMMKRKATITTTTNNKEHASDNQYYSNLRNFEEDNLKKLSTNQYDIIVKETGYNGSNNCVIRICSDCNTTKTPLWRSGPRGPKSLCNACGIRQRKARQAAMAAATANVASDVSPSLLKKKKKIQTKNKRVDEDYSLSSPSSPNIKICKRMMTTSEEEAPLAFKDSDQSQSKSTISSSSTTPSSNKFYFDDLSIILSKSSAYHQAFPQDEKEAAILLMALSNGMVHG